ncbi:MAG TPA: hypothetical protein VFS45_04975 [Sphingomicrobium sp.]|nr:hypothetical protein [Sphingomicrobium sp.]
MIGAMLFAASAASSPASAAVAQLIQSVTAGDRAAFAGVAPGIQMLISPDFGVEATFDDTRTILAACSPMQFKESEAPDPQGRTVMHFEGLCRVDDGPRPMTVDIFVSDGKVRGFLARRTD